LKEDSELVDVNTLLRKEVTSVRRRLSTLEVSLLYSEVSLVLKFPILNDRVRKRMLKGTKRRRSVLRGIAIKSFKYVCRDIRMFHGYAW
jgi:hypothetical protein